MQRRDLGGLLAAACLSALPGRAAAGPAAKNLGTDAWRRIEDAARGRLGVAVLDTGTGRLEGHRLDERFPLCSTFKWLAAACVLARVDAGQERLDRRVAYGRDVLLPHSPVTERHVAEGMTVGALCAATVTLSDNAAGNLLLESFGGPAALTAFARTLGDTGTRLDRMEPALNESRPGDPRDTTTPRGMATALRAAVLGEALAPASRAQLVQWLRDCKTNGERLAAALPAGWTVGSKTGTGERGSTNDVGVFWPPGGRAPIVVAAYLTETRAPFAQRQAAIAAVARRVTQGA